MDTTTKKSTTLSEGRAAEVLSVPRSTLMSWRKGGHLRDDLLVESQWGRPSGQGVAVLYDVAVLEGVTTRGESLFKVKL